ncbi:MAG: thiamine pyrophosphate-dependent enzyme, partial [Dehalococcoidia bacterium]
AMAFKFDRTDQVAVACFGDSAVETGQFWEVANFATLHQLPLMLVCENNQYATATHIEQRQPPTPIHQRVAGFMWSSQVDDGDVAAVYRAAQECRQARPGFLEISTYRYREHVGPDYDWDLGYRTREEVEAHMAQDPLPVVRSKLSETEASGVEEEARGRVQAAFASALTAPWPEAIHR